MASPSWHAAKAGNLTYEKKWSFNYSLHSTLGNENSIDPAGLKHRKNSFDTAIAVINLHITSNNKPIIGVLGNTELLSYHGPNFVRKCALKEQ
ncbi:hypothetical protein Tco_0055751, partial [Tanacetum coccineum]